MGLLDECVDHGLGVLAPHPGQQHKPRVTLDQRRDLRVVAAADQVAFPVTRYGTVLNLGRSLSDRDRVADSAVVLSLLRVMP